MSVDVLFLKLSKSLFLVIILSLIFNFVLKDHKESLKSQVPLKDTLLLRLQNKYEVLRDFYDWF
jgi:hypothetical protein